MTAALAEGRYARRVSQIERGYLNAATQGCTALIQMIVEGCGPLEPGQVRHAVAVATAVNPGLAVTRRGAVWRSGGPVPPVTTHLAAGGDGRTLAAPFLHTPLDVVTGPVAEIGLFSGVGGADTRLVARASHIVTDGRGLARWLDDVFRVLRGEEPVGSPAQDDDLHFVAAAGASSAAAATGGAEVSTFPSPLGPPEVADGPPTVWFRRRLPATASAVTARVAEAVSRRLRGASGRIMVPVDLRRHDRTVHSTANLSAPLFLDLRRDDSWERLHRELLIALLRKREVQQLSADFRRSNPFARTLADAQALAAGTDLPCSAIISDHGTVDLGRYHAPGFTPTSFYTLPMVVPYAAMFVSACETTHGPGPDQTELTLACRPGRETQAIVHAILDDTARLIAPPPDPTPTGPTP